MNKKNLDITKRCRKLQDGQRGEGPVVYWMSRDQRVADNWALLWAQQEAILRGKGLVVIFCLVKKFLEATPIHYAFMLESLQQTKTTLKDYNTSFYLFTQEPTQAIPRFIKGIDAHLLVCDFDPLRIKRQWKEKIKQQSAIPIYEVDAHNIVPSWLVSDKKEYAAYTFRPKIHRLLDEFLTDIPSFNPHPIRWQDTVLHDQQLKSNDSVFQETTSLSNHLADAGEASAHLTMKEFLDKRLKNYALDRNNPCLNGQSGLSPFIHFGHISAQRIAYQVTQEQTPEEAKEAFLEELIVRRELSDNYCYYEKNYDQFSAFPNWAKQSLTDHLTDKRPYLYSLDQLEQGVTHEELWNSCQHDLIQNGKLHGFLRMYWAKKILEWTPDPETALQYAITLNDRYSLDGRDPNGYAGIAWSIGGVHDRAWQERPIFGKVRYMNEAGCRRKFYISKYIDSVMNK